MTRIIVIGGVAAGMSAASQAKRLLPSAEVIALERGPDVSYGACGMPYNIGDPARPIDDLVAITRERFRQERGIEVRTGHEVRAIDTEKKKIEVWNTEDKKSYDMAYDKLVIATGARAFRPPLEGIDRPGVFVLRTLRDGAAMKAFIAERGPQRAVIVGAGYIGAEMAEGLRMLGLQVTVLEMMEQALPGWQPEIAALLEEELRRNGVALEKRIRVGAIRSAAAGQGLLVDTDRGAFEAELVLVSVGVRPNTELAQAAGIHLGDTRAIAVDDHMRTDRPDVFAAGDCAEAYHLVSKRPAYIPLGDTANKQGKVAGANAAGAERLFRGIVGTAGFKAFDLEVARTGLGSVEIERLGLQAVAALSRHRSVAHAYPGSQTITTVLLAEVPGGRLLGAQMIGRATVAKRIDVFATALHAGMTIDDVEALDLAYAPPLAPVYDPILVAATVAKKQVAAASSQSDRPPARIRGNKRERLPVAEDRKTYYCMECDKTIVIDDKDEIPVCCNQEMQIALPGCTAVHPEMARNTENDEPCDDGRGQGL